MGPPTYAGEHVYKTSGNATVTVYADDGTGLDGHNVSASMEVTINENLRPQFLPPVLVAPDKDVYDRGESITFTICVRDYEGDTVNITIDFDDGSAPVVVANIETEPKVWLNKTVNYTYEDGRDAPYLVTITVDDGMSKYRATKTPESQTVSISVEPKESSNLMLYVGIGVIVVVVVLLIVWMLMRKKKSEGAPAGPGGMEGMAPPPPPKT
jgi:cobalamin biosynthesis Mg chelatase CobN